MSGQMEHLVWMLLFYILDAGGVPYIRMVLSYSLDAAVHCFRMLLFYILDASVLSLSYLASHILGR